MSKNKRIIFILSLSFNALILLLVLWIGIKSGYEFFSDNNDSIIRKKIKIIEQIHGDQEVRQQLDQFKAILDDFHNFLLEEPFDREEAKIHLDKMAVQLVEIHQEMGDHLLNFLETLSPQERVQLAKIILKPKFSHRNNKERKKQKHLDD